METSNSLPQFLTKARHPSDNNADRIYLELLKDIHENGYLEGNSRTGVGTRAVFARQIRFKMSEGFPLLTTKKMFHKAGVYELLWFLGNHLKDEKYKKFQRANAKYLIDHGVNIWVGDLYKAYLKHIEELRHDLDNSAYGYMAAPSLALATKADDTPFSKEEFIAKIKEDDEFAELYADCGQIYGVQWRAWTVCQGKKKHEVDQLADVIAKLKTNPTDRRIMVSAWNVGDLSWGSMVLPPCHYGYTFFTRKLALQERIDLVSKEPNFDPLEFGVGEQVTEEHCHKVCDAYNVPKRALSLKWNQRSVDTPLGLPVNIMSYALLLEMISKEVNMVAEDLIGSLENVHYYLNQEEGVKEQLSRNVEHSLPTLWLNPEKSMFDYTYEDVKILGYESQSKIEFPLSN